MSTLTLLQIVTVYSGRATNVEFRLQENILVAGLPKHVFVVLAGGCPPLPHSLPSMLPKWCGMQRGTIELCSFYMHLYLVT